MLTRIYHKKDEHFNIEFFQDKECRQAFNFENVNSEKNIIENNDIKVYIQFVLPHDFIESPPVLNITSTHIFKYNIFKVIEKLKPFNDNNSWNIKYSIYDTILNIKKIIKVIKLIVVF